MYDRRKKHQSTDHGSFNDFNGSIGPCQTTPKNCGAAGVAAAEAALAPVSAGPTGAALSAGAAAASAVGLSLREPKDKHNMDFPIFKNSGSTWPAVSWPSKRGLI